MDYLKILKESEGISSLLCDICDVEILPAPRPAQDEGGHLEYNLAGEAFAQDGSGGEFLLLADGSVGYWGSEGQVGRIADDMDAFFEFMVNCPFWMDYRQRGPYEQGVDALRAFARELEAEHAELAEELGHVLHKARQTLAGALGVSLYKDVAEPVLVKFYRSANRSPRLIATYTEDDGEKHAGTGSLFD